MCLRDIYSKKKIERNFISMIVLTYFIFEVQNSMQIPRGPKACGVQIESVFLLSKTPVIRIKTSSFQHKKMILFGTSIFYFRPFSC
jgi:hypothetical protein